MTTIFTQGDAMRVRLAFAIALGAGGSMLAPANLHAQERFTLSGSEVTVHNLAGSLQVVGASGGSTVIEVRRVGRDAGELRIVPGTSTLRVIYPRNEVVYPGMQGSSETNLNVNDDGTFGNSEGSRRVRVSSPNRGSPGAMEAGAEITVHLPPGVTFNGHVAVGNAIVRDVRANVGMNTYSGGIQASGVHGNLSLRSSSGGVEARDVEGDVSVRAASGGVSLENVRGSDIAVRAASGRITATGLSAPTVELKASSGHVRAEGITGERVAITSASGNVTVRSLSAADARVSSASGSVEADLAAAPRVGEFRAVSGSVALRVPEGIGATVELRTASGGITVDVPLRVTEQRRGYTAGTIGDGSSRISARTTSGRIRLSGR